MESKGPRIFFSWLNFFLEPKLMEEIPFPTTWDAYNPLHNGSLSIYQMC